MISLKKNMEFKIKDGFSPNICFSESLKIIDVTDGSIIIQMNKSNRRGVFPSDHFYYWLNKGALVEIKDHQKRIS
ncbi:hypothetical protein ACUXCC_001932 [Cytobacillus horneckiae]|uniref:hypothetical protein n=1 Tax=Cytobacillus horneckiae TaxID=549687 RepID=UPI000A76F2B0|nr:hypothetical protein [Cytobacillus horneckiae]MCM3177928.1 hypothetical protein [Cytobacillus horneckiae]MEC1157265.1 hypothetical protein [Cytobacillus horneckiae]MED2935854.1 hypothetical protein [Cytobacillus horneckiae]